MQGEKPTDIYYVYWTQQDSTLGGWNEYWCCSMLDFKLSNTYCTPEQQNSLHNILHNAKAYIVREPFKNWRFILNSNPIKYRNDTKWYTVFKTCLVYFFSSNRYPSIHMAPLLHGGTPSPSSNAILKHCLKQSP